jgi:hypothetical protein
MMVPHEALINAIRSKKFTFKRQADRVEIYKQRGTTLRIMVRRNVAHDPEYAAVILRQAGFEAGEILKFVNEYDCRN